MKKFSLAATVIAVSALISALAYAGKTDLMLKVLKDEPSAGKAMLGKSVSEGGAVSFVDVLIKSTDIDLTRVAIEDAGGTVRSVIGDIMTAFVPVDFLASLDEMDEVVSVEASKRMTLMNDSSRANSGVATLQAGFEGVTYNGQNIVVGVIDTGLDYSRADFDNADGVTRVQYLRFQTATADGTMSVVECANDKVADGTCTIPYTNDSSTSHGTHVTGIAAGSDSTYTGVAPAADIMLVRNDYYDDISEDEATFSGGVIDGVQQIFKKSDILNKAAVVNISQGTHIGAHDNTSLLEQAVNAAVTGGYSQNGKSYGRSIVAAAGNEHLVAAALGSIADRAGGIHAPFNVPSGSSYAARLWVIDMSDDEGDYAPGRTPLIIDAWFGSGQADACSVAGNIYPYNGAFGASPTTTLAVAATGDIVISSNSSQTAQDSTKKVKVILATDPADPNNEKPRALFGFGPGDSGTWANIETDVSATGYVLDIIIRANGASCTGNMWIEGGGNFVNFMKGIDTSAFDVANGTNGSGYQMKTIGDNNMTVAIPATATSAIAVGAYLQEKPFGSGLSQWTDEEGTTFNATDINSPSNAMVNGGTVGQLCPFSSYGPTADNRVKPDVIAPGDPILSTWATGNNLDDFAPLVINSSHMKMQGTSQASPHVAGLIALLFQKNNTLTADQVKSALTGNTMSASVSKASNDVGYGKINATGAMSSISASTSGYSGTGTLKTSDLTEDDDDNTTTSKSGCGGMIAPSGGQASLAAIMALLPACMLFAFRRKK